MAMAQSRGSIVLVSSESKLTETMTRRGLLPFLLSSLLASISASSRTPPLCWLGNMMTEGFFVEDSRTYLETLAAQAARSGITIYSIDGRGNINSLSVNPDAVKRERARSAAFDTGEDGPNILTAVTGGFMIGPPYSTL